MGSAPITTDRGDTVRAEHASHALSTFSPGPRPRSRAILFSGLVAIAVAMGFLFAAPHFYSAAIAPQPNATIDGFVAGHVTAVSARAAAQVRRVLVDENKRVAE